jgi:hypothetical protein
MTRQVRNAKTPGAAVVYELSKAQTEFWTAAERYVDFEGAVRAGKTTPAVLKVLNSCIEHPGIQWLIARWTQDSTDAQLKARFRELCPAHALTGWNAQEQYFEIRTGNQPSRIYVRGLKASEDSARYSKFAGLTLAGVYVDQPEEIPYDFYTTLKARLSQPGYPHQMLLTPNPPHHDHWLAKEFPEDNTHADHRYIRTTVYDNRAALGEAYIQALEAAYPAGTVLRRRFIEGLRGLSVVGDPVYGGYFQRLLHARQVEMHPAAPLFEGWDFGHGHPCVVWAQFLPQGALHVLGGVMGVSMFIEDFCPIALQYRAQWFPRSMEVKSTGDPAGQSFSPHGVATSAIDVLKKYGVQAQTRPAANRVDQRDVAIQSIAGYMRRLTATGVAFAVAPRFVVVTGTGTSSPSVLVDGFEAGYVWAESQATGSSTPNTRRPLKDGYYDHAQNCLEYIVLAFGPMAERKPKRAMYPPLPVYRGPHGWMA